jgi:hypothetical protein
MWRHCAAWRKTKRYKHRMYHKPQNFPSPVRSDLKRNHPATGSLLLSSAGISCSQVPLLYKNKQIIHQPYVLNAIIIQEITFKKIFIGSRSS